MSWDEAAGDFGQKSDLCVRIREICRNYPEGTSIIKELVQNADDAGARDFKLCLDLRQHGTASVVGPGMAQYQGPAILAYNSAQFQEADFASIQRIGDSLKKATSKGSKTGRFGIGFNSVRATSARMGATLRPFPTSTCASFSFYPSRAATLTLCFCVFFAFAWGRST